MKTLTRKTVSVLLASALLMSGGAAASAKDSTSAAVSVSASAQVSAPAQVVNVKVKSVDETSAKLTWDKVNGAKGYRVYVLNTKTGKYKKVITLPKADKTSYKLTGLKAGKEYKYKVRAYVKDNGKTVWGKSSSAVSVSTPEMLRYEGKYVVINVPGEGNDEYETYKSLDTVVTVTSVKERDKLIKTIKKTYPESSDIVKQLKKYDEKFFKKNLLVYSLAVTEGADANFVIAKTDSVIKKVKGGKATVTVTTSSNEIIPNGTVTNDEWYTRFNCTFTELAKSDVKSVKAFKAVDKTAK